MKTKNIFDWVKSGIEERGWSMRELAHRMKVSPSAITDMLTYEKVPSLDMCKGLAKAFGVSDIEVLVIAGHLTRPPNWDADSEEMRQLFDDLSPAEKRILLATAKALKENRGE